MGATDLLVKNPSEIARETLIQLSARRLPPTPENYVSMYAEIGGDFSPEDYLTLSWLRGVVADIKSVGAAGVDISALEKALASRDLAQARSLLGTMCARRSSTGEARWGDAIRELLRVWDQRNPDWTQARKRESVDHVAASFGADGEKFYQRLRSLVKSWAERNPGATNAAVIELDPNATPAPSAPVDHRVVTRPEAVAGPVALPVESRTVELERPAVALRSVSDQDAYELLRDIAVELLGLAIGEGTHGDERLITQSRSLITRLQGAATPAELAAHASQIRALARRCAQLRGTQREMLQSLLSLLHLIVSNIEELVPDERWVKGQVDRLRSMIADPLDPGSLAEAEKAFREVIVKQSSIKKGIQEAQSALKAMLQSFIVRLSSVSEATGQYQAKVENYSIKIQAADDIGALSDIVKGLLDDTRLAQADITRSRDDLIEAQRRAQQYEEKVSKLERELSDVSSLLREDPLTGVLNRRGLAESFAVEAARSDRDNRSLCVALLDVDNFKKLNDTHGHETGDRALQHLAAIVREAIRPTDVVARYGGEEFVVLMPGTDAEEAVRIMTRVQRQLTRGFYMSDNQRMLITFSAGVTRRTMDESEAGALARADQGLYQAKATGKNKVVFV